MPLNQLQQQTLKDWMRSKAVIECPACGEDRWQFTKASYVRALLEADDLDLIEGGGGDKNLVRQLRVRGPL